MKQIEDEITFVRRGRFKLEFDCRPLTRQEKNQFCWKDNWHCYPIGLNVEFDDRNQQRPYFLSRIIPQRCKITIVIKSVRPLKIFLKKLKVFISLRLYFYCALKIIKSSIKKLSFLNYTNRVFSAFLQLQNKTKYDSLCKCF